MIALDLDNTLLTREGTLSARTLAALREAMARGVLVVLASGRMVEAMRNLAEEIPVNAPLIAFNGALGGTCGGTVPTCVRGREGDLPHGRRTRTAHSGLSGRRLFL